MNEKVQMFVSQPSENGYFEVAKWDCSKREYVPLEINLTEVDAIERARVFNKEYLEDDCKQ